MNYCLLIKINLIRLLRLLGLVLAFTVGGNTATAAPIFTLTLLPADGIVVAPAGSTTGWGYRITNLTDSYLVPMSLSADLFDSAMPWSLFDFPTIDPNSSVEKAFSTDLEGLYQLTWDINATPGTTNAGIFVLEAVLYDADPLAGGVEIGSAGNATVTYFAQVSNSTSIPEPSTIPLIMVGILIAGFRLRKATSVQA